MTLKGVVFDIDGTMANTLPVCIEAYQMYLEKRLKRPVEVEEITSHFGKSDEGILDALIQAQDGQTDTYEEYFQLYETLHAACKEPFPGIREALELLKRRNVPMGVVTGKGARSAEITLRILGLQPYFQVVETGSATMPNKHEAIRTAARRMGVDPEHLIYVGDTPYDMEAAAAAGVHPIGAGWAETSTLTGQEPQARHIFYRMEDFTAWLAIAFEHTEGQLRDNRFVWRFPSTI